MKTENNIVLTEDGYKIVSVNAQSVQTYGTIEDAEEASEMDAEAWENAEDAEEAETFSPVEWE